jgi:hypothetical protein
MSEEVRILVANLRSEGYYQTADIIESQARRIAALEAELKKFATGEICEKCSLEAFDLAEKRAATETSAG